MLNVFFFLNNFFKKKILVKNQFIEKVFYYFNWFLIISFTLIFIKIIFLVT